MPFSHIREEREKYPFTTSKGANETLEGYRKIRACCALAALEKWKYVWIDTCCIDKTSSVELSEAINSHFCYAYLPDVCVGGETLWGPSLERQFHNSRGFIRGLVVAKEIDIL